jgi:4-hydroxybenzoate polyprenyltransferase
VTPSIALRLGRVSNLPTVGSNVLAGVVLAGGTISALAMATLVVAASAFYVGGMFLNDAYDAQIDARERPERPIPSGQVSRAEVMTWGFGWLALGLALVAFVKPVALVAGAATCGLIVLYNRWHKGNPLGPVIMGLCRVGLYLIAASCAGGITAAVWVGAALLLSWVLGLTYVAKHEGTGSIVTRWPLWCLLAPLLYALPILWQGGPGFARGLVFATAYWLYRSIKLVGLGGPHIRTAVVSLIAGISLVDALLIVRAGSPSLALWAILAFGATLGLQRWVSGT